VLQWVRRHVLQWVRRQVLQWVRRQVLQWVRRQVLHGDVFFPFQCLSVHLSSEERQPFG
jgi:hypothetical protein